MPDSVNFGVDLIYVYSNIVNTWTIKCKQRKDADLAGSAFLSITAIVLSRNMIIDMISALSYLFTKIFQAV